MKPSTHFLHIITTKKSIVNQAEWFARDIDSGIVKCVALKKLKSENGGEYLHRLYAVCWRLHMIARLVYKGKNGISKLSNNTYRRILFEGLVETYEEVERFIDKNIIAENAREDVTESAHKVLRVLEMAIVPPIANTSELIYIHELASIIDYVIDKDGEVDDFEYNAPFLFPINIKEMEMDSWFNKFGDELL